MRRAFTLIELLAAVLISAMIVMMIAGALRTAINSWTRVQEQVGKNYNRRAVLDLLKRQSSSIFFKRDADALMQMPRFGSGRDDTRQAPLGRNQQNAQSRGGTRNDNRRRPTRSSQYDLPEGTDFFNGSPQELSFVSTVSFLSDFPGQVAVRYYVVQGSDEDGDLSTGLSSRTSAEDRELGFGESLEGGLYLYVEETNLFASALLGGAESSAPEAGAMIDSPDAGEATAPAESGQVNGAASMQLLGPLRDFSIRYRRPALRRAQEADADDDWAESWDLEEEGMYPSAIEFILFYEEPGITEELAVEDLQGIRMVIPIYDSRNLVRGGRNVQ